jgi:hypothetical protein
MAKTAEDKKNSTETKKLSLRHKLLIALFILLICLLAGVVVYLLTQNRETFEYESNVTIGEMPGVDREALLAQLQANTDKSAIAFSINTQPKVVNTTAQILYENPEGNDKDVVLSITDDETGETIYESMPVRPGSYMEYITLLKEYPPGVYGATAYFTAFDTETHEMIGQAASGLTLEVIEPE